MKVKNKPKWYDKTIITIDFNKAATYAVMFSIATLSLYVALKIQEKNHFNKLSNIEKRLAESCFKWNEDCDEELGNCVCNVKASSLTINYIMNK